MKRFTDPENTDENLWDDSLYERAPQISALAPPAMRFIHLLADGAAVLIAFYVFDFAVFYLALQTQWWPEALTSPYFNQLAIAIIYLLYCVLMEGYAGGQTLGKLITRYKVVDRSGEAPALKQILLRTLLRFVPFEFLSVVFAKQSGMWHDQWSRTLVVKVADNFLSRKNDVVFDDRS